MRIFLVFCLLIALVNHSWAKIDPFYKEVIQRGYPILKGDSVRLPDSSVCSINDFNSGVCGKEFFDQDYCVSEGRPAWREDVCCEGLKLNSSNADGQTYCVAQPWWNFGGRIFLYFFLGVLIPLGLFAILALQVKGKLKKNVRN